MKNLKSFLILLLVGVSIAAFAADNVTPSHNPPGGLSVNQVPLFVGIGFDDNAYSGIDTSGGTGGMSWATDFLATRSNPAGTNPATYDGEKITASFYLTTYYIEGWQGDNPNFVKMAWKKAMDDGHEIGNHSSSHGGSLKFNPSLSVWEGEISKCNTNLAKPYGIPDQIWEQDYTKGIGADLSKMIGFRTPFLAYSDATFTALQNNNFLYDTSIEEGWQDDQDGTNYFWPYTLDNGSPGHDYQKLNSFPNKTFDVTSHPGLWELSPHPVIVPPDELCAQYGIEPGLRTRLHTMHDWFSAENGKITGFDYNLWYQFKLTKAEFLGVLKYTFDLRKNGNRAPMMFGAHTDEYSSKWQVEINATERERQEAIEEFIDYALQHDFARVVSNNKIVKWCQNPVALSGGVTTPTPTATMTPLPTTTPTPTAPVLYNIAVGKKVVASSEFSADFPVVNTVDGNPATVWGSSDANASDWIYIDLGAPTAIEGIGLDWYGAFYAKGYKIAISNNAKDWTFVYEKKNGTGGLEEVFGKGTVRYIGFLFTNKNKLAYALKELKVYAY